MNIPDSPQLRTILTAATLVTLLVGGGVSLGVQQSQIAEMGRTTERLEQLINLQSAGSQAREARIGALELGAGRTDERLVSILAVLARIERQLETQPRP